MYYYFIYLFSDFKREMHSRLPKITFLQSLNFNWACIFVRCFFTRKTHFLIYLFISLLPQINPVEDGTRSALSDSMGIFNAISGTPTSAHPHGSAAILWDGRFNSSLLPYSASRQSRWTQLPWSNWPEYLFSSYYFSSHHKLQNVTWALVSYGDSHNSVHYKT